MARSERTHTHTGRAACKVSFSVFIDVIFRLLFFLSFRVIERHAARIQRHRERGGGLTQAKRERMRGRERRAGASIILMMMGTVMMAMKEMRAMTAKEREGEREKEKREEKEQRE